MKSKHILLWVDDDIEGSLKPFLDEMEDSGYIVIRARTPEEMWNQLSKNEKKIQGIIMDIMLPTGDKIKSGDAQMGVTTGLVLLELLKSKHKYSDIPILIFTILNNQKVFDWAKKYSVPMLRKQETFPEELVDELTKILKPI